MLAKKLSSRKEEGNTKEQSSSVLVREMLRRWTKVGDLLEQFHPNITAVYRNANWFDEHLINIFREVSKKRQRQVTLGTFTVK